METTPNAQPGSSTAIEPTPPSHGLRPPVTNVLRVAQQLAETFGSAQALLNRLPADDTRLAEGLRRCYHQQHPADRARRLWQCFGDAKQIYEHLDAAVRLLRQTTDLERKSLSQGEAERAILAEHRLPITIEEEATRPHGEAVRRYEALRIECQQRQAAIAELQRLPTAPEQTLSLLGEATVRLLEAVVTIERETFVGRLRENRELEHLRARFERLKAMANTHEAEIEEWSRRVGHPVRVPRVMFPWPSAAIWDALIAESVENPKLVWDNDPGAPATSSSAG